MIGFTSEIGREKELEKLREAMSSLNDLCRTIEAGITQIDVMNFGMVGPNLKAATWHAEQAKNLIREVGQSKKGTRKLENDSTLQ
jgi:hypothetical protein